MGSEMCIRDRRLPGLDETCDRLDGGAERWRRLGGGGVQRTVVAV